MFKKPLYISTTLPYANGKPHLGHLFELVLADIFARGKSQLGHEVHFNTGLDEHGKKIALAAHPQPLEQYRQDIRDTWKKSFDSWGINLTSFYLTHNETHHGWVIEFWNKLVEAGVLEKRDYKGLYCVGCEAFKTPTELQEGICQDHPNLTPEQVHEENYFFLVDSFKDKILEHAKSGLKLQPEAKRTELISFAEGISDFSVSRKRDPQSNLIPSPDPDHDIYVWLDALTNYIYAIGYHDNPLKYKRYWEEGETIQICGPDNLKFQGVLWQYLLQANGSASTNTLLVHGTIKDADGRKFSKTLGNVIDPQQQIEKYGIDAVRYYIAAGLNTYKDSCWDEQALIKLHDAHLVNAFGNLARRITSIAKKFEITDFLFKTRQEVYEEAHAFDAFNADNCITLYNEALFYLDNYQITEATEKAHSIIDIGNLLFTNSHIWNVKIINEKEDGTSIRKAQLALTWLSVLLALELYQSIIPNKCAQIQLEISKWHLNRDKDPEFIPEPVLWFKPLKIKAKA